MSAEAGPVFTYIVRCEFDSSDLEDDWNSWYDEHHIAAMLSVPGVLSVQRFAELGAPRRYMAIYELASLEVFDTPEYHQVRGWGDWGPYIASWSRTVLRPASAGF